MVSISLAKESMFDPASFVKRAVEEVEKAVGDGRAIAACSGGVDSTVAAVIAKLAIGDRLKAIYIDDGFRRFREPELSIELLRKVGLNVELVDAKLKFFKAVEGLEDAEDKRKAFRHTFYKVLGGEAEKFEAKFLVQGTIAADVMETVGGIKTQHNVLVQVGLDPGSYGFQLIEPLKELYKPQVREVARYLGLPKEVSERMPFPGPGLLIRVVGEVTPEKVEVVRMATKVVEEEAEAFESFQAFTILLKGMATGVVEGRRAYGRIVAIRIVESKDALRATAKELPYKVLKRMAKRIINEVPGVARVLYDVTDKPPATIEFE